MRLSLVLPNLAMNQSIGKIGDYDLMKMMVVVDEHLEDHQSYYSSF